MWTARRPHHRPRDGQRRLGATEVAYRTASGGVLIVTAPAGHRPLRVPRPAIPRRSG